MARINNSKKNTTVSISNEIVGKRYGFVKMKVKTTGSNKVVMKNVIAKKAPGSITIKTAKASQISGSSSKYAFLQKKGESNILKAYNR